MVALREDGRYVERLVRATLDGGHHEAVVRADGSYIITGGLGGLGTVVTRWLVERGAGRIVLNGRSEPSDAQREDLDGLGTDDRLRGRRHRHPGSGGAVGGRRRRDRTAAARTRARRRRDRRRPGDRA